MKTVHLGSGTGEDSVSARRAAGTDWGENRARGRGVRRKREAREAGYRDTSQWGQTTSSHKGARDRARGEALGKGKASSIHNEGEVKNDDNEAEYKHRARRAQSIRSQARRDKKAAQDTGHKSRPWRPGWDADEEQKR
jgi:hypothetical protein